MQVRYILQEDAQKKMPNDQVRSIIRFYIKNVDQRQKSLQIQPFTKDEQRLASMSYNIYK